MKKIFLHTLLIFIISNCLFSGFFINIIQADDYYELIITEKDYEVGRIRPMDIIEYNISITLKNIGNIVSDNITIEIEDEDWTKLHKNYTFSPEESKTFIFLDPLIGQNAHQINISFYPTDPYTERNDLNSGEDIYVIYPPGYKEKTDTTPGFSLLIIFLAISMYIIFRKQKNK